ncbi:hypothetical protein CcrKarma_gp284 [Caulobacter virus Karma]|uniref:Uncharacterized protein n=1 Tax=Caulobacter phage CcrSwift TaxID=2927984 RepID=K4JXC5_9CAUD|nr:hypothetical protein CcrKarma_gp284 [Caulobacter virus Karma]YP_006990008.1 hypothetical protein D870_gp146 [Caulobacter phage CcrSwift]AFU87801.1 hypothetical protein CcrKarma_gp284 [Caulobacter virus Karma]AFU88593.1 hypothetical protein CcrSwift_gp275 [Caulobacter phage CcrSwift]
MPHLSKTPFDFDFTSDALAATLEFERNTTEFYRYETVFTSGRAATHVLVMEEDGNFVGFVSGEA